MKILLIGDYSGLHFTLAGALLQLGHRVTLASDGDGFKNYSRQVDFRLATVRTAAKLRFLPHALNDFSQLKGYDVVQLINPVFFPVQHLCSALYHFLKKRNGKIFLGAFGNDCFYTRLCLQKKLPYSEFYIGDKPTGIADNEIQIATWLNSFRERLNRRIADQCNGIIACLPEYYRAYSEEYASKLTFIPLPVDVDSINFAQLPLPERVVFFLGINPGREAIKGSNLFQQAFDRLRQKTGHGVDLLQVTALPYSEYQTQMSRAHTVLDQTFSQSPAMNALLALAMGKIVVSNAQKEYYSMLGEKNNFPVIDIFPNVEDIETKLEYVIASIDSFPQWSNQGRLFVEQHHNAKEIARQYLDFWNKC